MASSRMLVLHTSLRVVADLVKSPLMHIDRLKNGQAKCPKRMMTKVQWLCSKGTSSIKERETCFGRSLVKYMTIGLRISGDGAAVVCEKWHPPECLFYMTKSGCRFGEKVLIRTRQVDEQPTKRSKKKDDKSEVALLEKGDWHESARKLATNYVNGHDRSGRPDKKRDHKLERGSTQRRSSDARQLGCVFQDMTPPKSILRKSTNMQKSIRRVKFTKDIARHTKIRDQNPSLGYICPGELHQRNPNAPKIEDRSQEETEWQERWAREAAWKLAKNVLKLKEHERATFFSPSENWCLLSPSNLKT